MLHLVGIGFLLLGQQQPEFPAWFPAELRSLEDYSKWWAKPVRISDRSVTVIRPNDNVRIHIFVRTSKPEWASKSILDSVSGGYKGQGITAPSGLPMAKQVLETLQPGALWITAIANYEECHLGFYGPPTEVRPLPRRLDNFNPERQLAEALVRKSLSGYASRRLAPSVGVNVAGHAVPGFNISPTDTEFVEFSRTADRLGVSFYFSDFDTHLNFIWNEVPYLLLLGADTMKRNSEWLPLPDIPILKEGKWLVPKAVFARP